MPLLDHFRPPLDGERHWESMHTAWATCIMGYLNESVLPANYFAEAQVHVGSQLEVDVATLEREASPGATSELGNGAGRGAAVATEVWAPPIPGMILPGLFPDDIEIQVFGARSGRSLAAAIELVSPGNKDRPETRQAFAAKCHSLLQMGIGLVIIDVVTGRKANLHDELARLMSLPQKLFFPSNSELYAVAYRPLRLEKEDRIECWPTAIGLDQALTVMPLPLRGGPTLPLDLETTYMEARRRSRL